MTRVVVIGAGAIGGYLAGRAADAGHEVVVCARSEIDAIRLECDGVVRTLDVRVVTRVADVASAEVVVVATKTHQVHGVRHWLHAAVTPATTVLVAQNGIDHQPVVAELPEEPGCGRPRVVPSVLHVGAGLRAPGWVVHRGGDLIYVPDDDGGRHVAMVLSGDALQVVPTTQFRRLRWEKFCLNVGTGAVTALFRAPLGITEHPAVSGLVRGLADEAVAVGRARGVALPEDLSERIVLSARSRSPDHRTSMLDDTLAGRPLELAALNQTVVDTGAEVGVPTPLNELVVHALTARSEIGG
ncbi:2-dehydropantoate 2-reductase [Streptosporangium sp. NPDC001681]|uniref:ketopantoate reductase family protein n=1 Tax=Streptosporangium sp. NPDC001681 TaxID=3154395 RepID=UPI00331F7EDE